MKMRIKKLEKLKLQLLGKSIEKNLQNQMPTDNMSKYQIDMGRNKSGASKNSPVLGHSDNEKGCLYPIYPTAGTSTEKLRYFRVNTNTILVVHILLYVENAFQV